jgi:hypothetical protein
MHSAAKSAFIRGAAAALALLAGAAPMPGSSPPQQVKTAVRAEGCVEAGVEARCLILRDLKTGHLYNLLFPAARPPVGLGIEFTGVLRPGPSACMQGIAVEVTNWAHKASLKCAPGQAGKPGRVNPH